MPQERRWPREAWFPLLAGLWWLWCAPEHGLVGFLFSVVPGSLLLGSGVSMLLMPGDRRIAQFAASGGLLGVLFALPAFVVVGLGAGLLLVAVSAAGYLAAGFHSVQLEPHIEGVPDPVPSLRLAAEVAVDETLLAWLVGAVRLPTRDDHVRVERELSEARELFDSRGWLEKPEDYHRSPPPLEVAVMRHRRAAGSDFEHLSFDSGYEPDREEPGRERWLSYARNRTAHAWVLRHRGPPRPWLVCLHGYAMGSPWLDLAVFRPRFFHHQLGLNLIVPTLPLHGLRAIGRRSGESFFRADVMDMIHAEAQAMWDVRRCLSWLREQGDRPVGVFGLSLGGYNAALLATLEEDLACVVAGIPVTDFARIVFRHGPPLTLRTAREIGLLEERMREIKRVISPLELPPAVPRERRYIFAGVADRIVPADQVRDLWRHWEEPHCVWYQGAHCSFRAHAAVSELLSRALRHSGLSA